ncbi:MAG: YHS domain-containing (seleno)protein [Pseudomonadota bacterium]
MSFLSAFALMLTPAVHSTAAAKDPVYQSFFGTAIDGTDPVAYFTEGRPVEGSSDHVHEWNGAKWRFSSAENLALFAADPEKYAPQYGGYCAWAVAQGYTASTDPNAWKIVDGKLYLNYNKSVQTKWEGDIPGHIASADGNWPKILD